MIKPYEKRFSFPLVHSIPVAPGEMKLKTLQPSSLVRDHALQARLDLTIVCSTDTGNPQVQSNTGKKM